MGETVWATALREVESAAQQVQDAVRTTVQQEVQSAMQQVQEGVRSAAQPAARQVRETVHQVVQQEAQSAAQAVRQAMRAAVEQEMQAAEPQVQEAVPAAAGASAQTPVQARRASRGRASRRFQKGLQQVSASFKWVDAHLKGIIASILIPIIISTAIAVFANDYYTSRIGDWFRRGTSPVSTEIKLERASLQGLTWVFRDRLGVEEDLGTNALLALAQAATAPNEFNDWARRHGGIDVDASFIRLTVTGNRQAGVTITDIQAKVDKRGPPLRGALFYAPPEGEQENAQIGFDLDEAVPVARRVEPNKNFGDRGYLGDEYFMKKSIDLALDKHQVFSIIAMTTSYYYAWHLEIEVQAGGRTKYITVDLRAHEKDSPLPFQISARADLRNNKKGNFAVYKELYVLDKSTDHAGFIPTDPQTYDPQVE